VRTEHRAADSDESEFEAPMVATDADTGGVSRPHAAPAAPRGPAEPPASSPAPLPRRARFTPRLIALLALAAVLGIGIPLWAAVATGSISIPHNDAWSYSRIAQGFARTGHIRLLGWNRSSLVGQFVILGPLGSSIAVQQVFVAVLGLVCLAAVYDLAAPAVGRDRAALAAATMALWPGFGLLSTSFMPDIPTLAACLCTLALGRRALAGGSWVPLVLAAAVGLWGVTIREQAVAAPAAVFVAALAVRRHRAVVHKPALFGVAAAFGAAAVAFELWRRSLPAGDAPVYSFTAAHLDSAFNTAVQGCFTVGLAVSPAVLFVARPWVWRRSSQLASVAMVGVSVWAVRRYHVGGLFPGNYLTRNGAYAGAAYGPGQRMVFSARTWDVLVALACVGAVLLAGLLVEHHRTAEPLPAAFVVITLVGTLATSASGQYVFDRYWIALPAVLLPVALARTDPARSPAAHHRAEGRRVPGGLLGRAQVAVALAAGLVLAGVSLGLTVNGLVFDAARWHQAQALTAAGVPARDIDAGLEWVGYSSPHGVQIRTPSTYEVSPYDGMFPADNPCFVVTAKAEDQPGWTLVNTTRYATFEILGTSSLYVYDSHLAGCPAGPR
jgi:hypothetical protein